MMDTHPLMSVLISPPHHRLHNRMKLVQFDIRRNRKTSPNRRRDAIEFDTHDKVRHPRPSTLIPPLPRRTALHLALRRSLYTYHMPLLIDTKRVWFRKRV